MKLAIASDDMKTVTGHIGRVRGFVILEVENGEITSREYRQNLFTHHGRKNNDAEEHDHQHRHGHGHGHERLAEGLKGCSHLICHGAGWRVLEDLKKAGIETVFTFESDVEQAAVKFEKGELEINEEGACHSH